MEMLKVHFIYFFYIPEKGTSLKSVGPNPVHNPGNPRCFKRLCKAWRISGKNGFILVKTVLKVIFSGCTVFS